MNNQLWQIIRSYYRRPFFIVLMLCSIAVYFTIAVVFPWIPGSIQLAPVFQHSSPTKYLSSRDLSLQSEEDDAQDYRGLVLLHMKGISLNGLERFQNIETLNVQGGEVTLADAEIINSLPNLKSVYIDGDATPNVYLALSDKLYELSSGTLLYRNPDVLKQLEHVRVLRSHTHAMTSELAANISQLPNLELLAVSTREPLSADPDIWKPLADHPKLHSIYTDSSNDLDDAPLRQALPATRFLPKEFPTGSVMALWLGPASFGIAVLAVSIQVWIQFLLPTSYFMRGYDRPVLLVAIFWLLLFLFALGLIGMRHAFDPVAFMAISLALPAVAIALSMARLAKIPGQSIAQAIFLACCFSTFFIVQQVMTSWQSELVWFMQGHQPQLLYSIVFVELGLAFFIVRMIPRLPRLIGENFAKTPPSHPWEKNAVEKVDWNRANQFQLWLFSKTQDFERTGNSFWAKVRIWRLGNPMRPAVFALFVFAFALAVGASSVVQHSVFGMQLNWDVMKAGSFGFAVLPIQLSVFLPCAFWSQRWANLETMSLVPVSRAQLTQQLFAALARDQVIGWLLALPFALTAVYMNGKTDPVWLLATTAGLLAGATWLFAGSTAVFAYRSSVALVTVCVIFLLAPLVLVIPVAIFIDAANLNDIQTAYTFLMTALTMIGISALVVRWMYHKALQREWGATDTSTSIFSRRKSAAAVS